MSAVGRHNLHMLRDVVRPLQASQIGAILSSALAISESQVYIQEPIKSMGGPGGENIIYNLMVSQG